MKEFRALYHEVFDLDGNVKNCGRAKTRKLIVQSKLLEPEVDFGNPDTGFMKIDAIKGLYQKIQAL